MRTLWSTFLLLAITACGMDLTAPSPVDAGDATSNAGAMRDAATSGPGSSGVEVVVGEFAFFVRTAGPEQGEPVILTAQYVAAPYQFEVLEDVNHWVPELAADKVNALLLDHLHSFAATTDEAP
jgi:hypothetical protein